MTIVNFSKPRVQWASVDYDIATKEKRIKHVYLREVSDFKVHSTQIREIITDGKDVSAYINKQTEEYINKNKIFN